MPYKINEMGYIFLKIMEIEFNFDLQDPNAILDFIKRDKGEFRCSVYNPNFYPRAAKEIMDKLFTSDEQKKLKTLMTELKEAEVSLITNASSAVEEIMNKYKNEKNNVGELENEEDLSAFMTNVVC
jgi:hypothetical protein